MKYCSKRGHELMDDDKFCPKCGFKVDRSEDIIYQRAESNNSELIMC